MSGERVNGFQFWSTVGVVVTPNGTPVRLSQQEFRIAHKLVKAGCFISLDDLTDYVYSGARIDADDPRQAVRVSTNKASRLLARGGVKFKNSHGYGYGVYVEGEGLSEDAKMLSRCQ